MLEGLKLFWAWLIDGLTEAAAMVLDRVRRKAEFRLKMGQQEADIFDEAGAVIGKILEDGGATVHFEPQTVSSHLKGGILNVEIPPAWVLRRSLNPIAVQSAPFVDAFARHHIERITPWRADDTYFRVTATPIKDNSSELAVEIDVVAKRMVEPALNLLAQSQPAKLRLFATREESQEKIFIPVDSLLPSPLKTIRRNISFAVVLIPLLFVCLFVFLPWRLSTAEAEIGDFDHQIAVRKKILFGNASGNPDADPLQRIRLLRYSHLRAVNILEELSASLPDKAYLTDFSLEGNKLRISGLAIDSSDLPPALERSTYFAGVTFTAATTREENGKRDRFHLEMRVIDPKADVPAGNPAPESGPR